VQLSTGAPMPETAQLNVLGGEQEALLAAADLVRSLQGNEGFTAMVDLEPSA